VKPIFSLPTKKQWIRAARGESTTSILGVVEPILEMLEGMYLANFKAISTSLIHVIGTIDEYVVVSNVQGGGLYEGRTMNSLGFTTTAVGSYWPNQFGVYNMSGNVAEFVADDTVAMGGSWNDPGYDVSVESEQPAAEPTSTIGFRVIAQLP
jgi:formylglycine-generating enzyme required for sulfatase activity